MIRPSQFSLALLAVGAALQASPAWAQSLAGRWDASVSVSRGSGPYEVKARADISHEIETLLAEKR